MTSALDIGDARTLKTAVLFNLWSNSHMNFVLHSQQSQSGLHAHKHSDKATSHRMLGTEHTQRAISDSVSIKARAYKRRGHATVHEQKLNGRSNVTGKVQ